MSSEVACMNDFPEFEKIKEKILDIAKLARRAVHTSVEALIKRNSGLCDKVNRIEKETDFINTECEDLCYEILASRKLPTESLRFVTTAINISGRFERTADLAAEICQYSIRGLPKPLPEPALDIKK
jgi:phosphate uptake regulator